MVSRIALTLTCWDGTGASHAAVWGLETCISLKHLAALFQFLEKEHLFIVVAAWHSPTFTSNNCSLQCCAFWPCRNRQQSLFLCRCNCLQWIILVPLSSSLLPFLIPFFTRYFWSVLLFSFCPALNIMNCFHWKCLCSPLTMSDKDEDRTVGGTSLSPTAPWKATLASSGLSDLFCLRLKSVSWRSRSAKGTQSYCI